MKKRRWFQIHLSTLLLVVFWCATMQLLSHKGLNLNAVKVTRDGWTVTQLGFPLRTFEEIRGTSNGERFMTVRTYPENVLFDVVFWITSIFALGFISEFIIRGRETRKPREVDAINK